MDKYILLANTNEPTLRLEVLALRYFYGGEVRTASNAEGIRGILEERGRPELLVASLDFFTADEGLSSFIEHLKFVFPVIATSDLPDPYLLIKKFPVISGVLEGPVTVDAFTYLVKGLITTPAESPSHVPIDIKTILDLGCRNVDLFLRLSGTNYVRIVDRADVFTALDARKLLDKGVRDLHLLSSDAYELLRSWERALEALRLSDGGDLLSRQLIAIETLESVEKIARAMNWSREVLLGAQRTITQAIEILSTDDRLASLLKKRLSNKTSAFSRHVGLQSFLCCAFSADLDWVGEGEKLKLVLAALLHDLALENYDEKNIRDLNGLARNRKEKEAHVVKYRLHPVEAAKVAQALDVVPPDVDQIILQHHECLDGSGFPRGLQSSRILPLAALFIMAEDLVDFIGEGENLETSLTDYLTWGQARYDEGQFKKIFDAVRYRINPNQ